MASGEDRVYRLLQAFRAGGADGLISRKRGGPSNRALGSVFRETVLPIVRERYTDFGPTLQRFSEPLACSATSDFLASSNGMPFPAQLHPSRVQQCHAVFRTLHYDANAGLRIEGICPSRARGDKNSSDTLPQLWEALYGVYPAAAGSFLARVGDVPVQRLKAWLNAPISE